MKTAKYRRLRWESLIFLRFVGKGATAPSADGLLCALIGEWYAIIGSRHRQHADFARFI